MNAVSLVLVGMNPAARAVAIAAAQSAFPGASVAELPSIDAALQTESPAAGTQLLLLGDADQSALAQAVAATDAVGFRRWPAIVFGAGPLGVAGVAATVEPEDWQPRLVARVLHAAVHQHALEREIAHLRGDLSTIGRRISHDLRTPLAAIYSACEALNETKPEQMGDITVFTRSIATSTNELMQLIERMSFVLKASAEPVARDPVLMDEIVFATMQRLEVRLLRQGASVIRPKAWPAVKGVGNWLEMIWLNLLDNAVQHGGPQARIEIGWHESPGVLRFWVDDRGRGVPPEKVGKLFQPFNLLHRLNAPRGLGLSLVHRLVELQGGTCGYEPREGGGAHFYFTLPAAVIL